jgi:DNA (cytosine-5)-methyltransferase 1
MNELALFAGAGGGMLAGKILGWRTVCAVENAPYAASVLLARQNDGSLPPFPIWDDIRTFDGRPWRGIVDVVSGGFPCQDISAAGRGAGIEGEQSGLWYEMLRVVQEISPRYVFIENSPMLRTRGLEVVLRGLADAGFNAKWCRLGANHVGAPHRRNRIWIVADTNSSGCKEQWWAKPTQAEHKTFKCTGWWQSKPGVGRVANGVAYRVDRLKAIGNGQVPQCAAEAWRILTEG